MGGCASDGGLSALVHAPRPGSSSCPRAYPATAGPAASPRRRRTPPTQPCCGMLPARPARWQRGLQHAGSRGELCRAARQGHELTAPPPPAAGAAAQGRRARARVPTTPARPHGGGLTACDDAPQAAEEMYWSCVKRVVNAAPPEQAASRNKDAAAHDAYHHRSVALNHGARAGDRHQA